MFTRHKRVIPFVLLLVMVFMTYGGTQAAPIGQGSYTTTLPAGETGPTNSAGTPVTPKVVSGFSGPVQTNDWWSSLIWQHDPSNPYSNNMFPHPLALRAYADGLGMSYPTNIALNNEYHLHFQPEDIRIGLVGLSAPDTRVVSYSDWAVTARWSSGSNSLDATFGHGLPFVYLTKSGANAQVSVITGYQGTWYNSGGVLGIQVNGHYYAIFAPTGSTWSGSNPFQSSLNGQTYFSVAVLPDNSATTLEFYRQHAYAFVTNTQVSWNYNQANANLQTNYTVSTVLKESGNGNVNRPLLALYRHQWMNSSAALTGYTYGSPRGEMKVLDGASFSTNMTFNGVLPALPDAGTYDRTQLYNYVNDVYVNGPYIDSEDTYWGGKDAGRLAQLVWIADQVGHTSARNAFLNALRTTLEDWLNANDGGSKLMYYDSTWDTLIGFPASFGTNTEMNDHDFHYGYWLMAAATVANFDPAWANDSQWGGMVKLLIKDVANADRTDTMFPFLRSFDIYAGHDWANGAALFASGDNEESSSEAMNFASGLVLWGAATGNTSLRDLGIYLYTNMTRAIEQYWFDVDGQVFPAAYNYEAVGMVWGSGGAYATWWTANPEEIHGINFLPFTGGSLYLGRNPGYITRNYNFMVAQNGGQETEWVDVIWNFQALANPTAALSKFGSGSYPVEDGESKAHTYHWLHNLNAIGQLDTAVTADSATFAVFNKNGTRTYVAYNPGSTSQEVHFSDGKCLTVAPGKIGHGPGATNCSAPPDEQQPYGGTPWAIPGHIEAENYDTGGQDVAYNDTDSSNNGGAYRTEGVDIQGTSDTGSGYNVGWIAGGEWLEYTVNVASSGTYDLAVRVASLSTGGTLHMELDGANVSGSLSFAATGGWQTWTTVTATGISLTAGQHVLRLALDSSSFNVNWMEWTQASPPDEQQPYGGTPWTIPGRIEAENYDTGGQGIAYNDTDSGNNGGAYRSEDVDIEGTSDTGGGYNVGWTAGGEWLEYTVNVANSGTYDLAVRVASLDMGGTLHMEVDGANVSGALSFAATGGWQTWTTVTTTGIPLTAGQHVLRLALDSSGFNVNWVEWTQASPPTQTDIPGIVTSNAGAFNNGETKSWDVNVTQTGNYRLWVTSTSSENSRAMTIEFDGRSIPISLNSGQTVPIDFANVSAGANTLRITANTSGVSLGQIEFVNY